MEDCEICGGEATSYCESCASYYCNSCSDLIHKHPKRRDHQSVALQLDEEPHISQQGLSTNKF